MSSAFRELRLACRRLAARPVLVVVAVMSMGLGIGVNTAMFSLFNTVFLQAPSAVEPDRLVRVEFANGNHVSYPNAKDLIGTKAVEGMAAYAVTRVNLRTHDSTTGVRAMAVSPEFFPVVGLQPSLGRALSAEEDATVITEGFRRRHLGGHHRALGAVLDVNGRAYTVVGVLSDRVRAVTGAIGPDLYLPLAESIVPGLSDRRRQVLSVLARLRPGQSATHAAAALAAPARWLERVHPTANQQFGTRVYVFPTTGLAAWQTRDVPPSLLAALATIPFAVCGVVLAIACANVAALLLAHGAARRREIAIRIALGASRRQVATTMMAESLVLAMPGALVGVGLAYGVCRVASTIVLPSAPAAMPIDVDGSVVLFATALAVMAALTCGALPALELIRKPLPDALGRGTDRQHGRLLSHRALVVGQVIASTMLVLLAARCIQSLAFIQRVDPGFAMDEVATAHIGIDPARYGPAERLAFAERCLGAIGALPGVEIASVASLIPLSGDVASSGFEVAGSAGQRREAHVIHVGPRYFDTMRIQLGAGRAFGATDRSDGPAVAIVSQAFVEAHALGTRAIGTRVRNRETEPWVEIVGVVANSKHAFFGEKPPPIVYRPFLQAGGSLHILARTTDRPEAIVPALRRLLSQQDPGATIDVRTLRDATRMEANMRAVGSWTLATLGGLGLALALVGLSGLIAYTVTLRKRELAIRMAVGASPSRVQRLVIGQAVSMVALGFASGAALVILVTRPFGFVFSDTSAADPFPLGIAAALFLSAAAAAAYRPARQAGHTQPANELR
jgi:predicted permease